MRPETSEEARAWFDRAACDLRAGHVLLAAAPELAGEVLFHCQQAVEKALKGFLAAHERPFRKTHDLDLLGRACEEIEPDLGGLVDPVRDISAYAWVFRYPGAPEAPSLEEAADLLAKVRAVVTDLRLRAGLVA